MVLEILRKAGAWLGCLTILACVNTGALVRAASITLLENVFPGFASTAYAVSADGKVVVGQYRHDQTKAGGIAFIWRDGVITNLSNTGSWAGSISADGRIAVGYTVRGDNLYRAVRWENGVETELGDLPGGAAESWANGISGDGSTIVGVGTLASGRDWFRWTQAEGMTGLGISSGISGLEAVAVSHDGAVVVGNDAQALGARWESGSLVRLPGFQRVHAVSSDGGVLVGRTTSPTEAFRWSSASGIVLLGDLPGGNFNSEAFGVSSNGSTVVGWSDTGRSGGMEAFVWSEAMGMRLLSDVLFESGVNITNAEFTLLRQARGISANGRFVVGTGHSRTGGRAWLVDLEGPPVHVLAASELSLPHINEPLKTALHFSQLISGVLAPTLGNDGRSGRLEVEGQANLNGTLLIKTAADYRPRRGDEFTVLSCSNLVGRFAAILGDTLPNGLKVEPIYESNAVKLVVRKPDIEGIAKVPGSSLLDFSDVVAPTVAAPYADNLPSTPNITVDFAGQIPGGPRRNWLAQVLPGAFGPASGATNGEVILTPARGHSCTLESFVLQHYRSDRLSPAWLRVLDDLGNVIFDSGGTFNLPPAVPNLSTVAHYRYSPRIRSEVPIRIVWGTSEHVSIDDIRFSEDTDLPPGDFVPEYVVIRHAVVGSRTQPDVTSELVVPGEFSIMNSGKLGVWAGNEGQASRVIAGRRATLGGVLSVGLSANFQARRGDLIPILSAPAIVGRFRELEYPRLSGDLTLLPLYGESNVVLEVRLGPPRFERQPTASQTVAVGRNVMLSPLVRGTGPIEYQWKLNGSAIAGATNLGLERRNIALPDGGSYTLTASNPWGATTSSRAEVRVDVPALGIANLFRDRVPLAGAAGRGRGSNVNATREVGEPRHASKAGRRTVWALWTAPTNGIATVSTAGSDFDTTLAVYTGNELSQLREVASNDDSGGFLSSRCEFGAEAGQAYSIAVSGPGEQSGSVVLDWSFRETSETIPVIDESPQSVVVATNDVAVFRVVARAPGGGALTYRWLRDGQVLAGETGSALRIQRAQNSDVGRFVAEIRVGAGPVVETEPASLEVGSRTGDTPSQEKPEDLFSVDELWGDGNGAQPQAPGPGVGISVSPGVEGAQGGPLPTPVRSVDADSPCSRQARGTRWYRFQPKADGVFLLRMTNTVRATMIVGAYRATLLKPGLDLAVRGCAEYDPGEPASGELRIEVKKDENLVISATSTSPRQLAGFEPRLYLGWKLLPELRSELSASGLGNLFRWETAIANGYYRLEAIPEVGENNVPWKLVFPESVGVLSGLFVHEEPFELSQGKFFRLRSMEVLAR